MARNICEILRFALNDTRRFRQHLYYCLKLSKGKPFAKKFRPDLDNIPLFNDVFPSSRYEILGYGEFDGEFVRILEQPYVKYDGSEDSMLSPEERVEYMDKIGFKPINKEKTAFTDGEIVISDLQKGNIIRDISGLIK